MPSLIHPEGVICESQEIRSAVARLCEFLSAEMAKWDDEAVAVVADHVADDVDAWQATGSVM